MHTLIKEYLNNKRLLVNWKYIDDFAPKQLTLKRKISLKYTLTKLTANICKFIISCKTEIWNCDTIILQDS